MLFSQDIGYLVLTPESSFTRPDTGIFAGWLCVGYNKMKDIRLFDIQAGYPVLMLSRILDIPTYRISCPYRSGFTRPDTVIFAGGMFGMDCENVKTVHIQRQVNLYMNSFEIKSKYYTCRIIYDFDLT